jgi:hypothetical protein
MRCGDRSADGEGAGTALEPPVAMPECEPDAWSPPVYYRHLCSTSHQC